jgi:diguanylate cyclase (GGDEF)-like protein/PAS domain S-box-containing protein
MNDTQLFQTLTKAVPGLVWVCDDQGRVEFNNAHWGEFTGMLQEKGLGHGWLDAIHPADAAAFRAQLPLSGTVQETIRTEIRVRRQDGEFHRHLLSVRQVGEGKWVGCAIDAHEWLATELRDTTQGNILDMVSAGADLDAVLSELCRAAEKQIPGATCSVLLVDATNGCFVCGIAPGMPASMLAAVPRLKIGTGVGSCGTAAFEKRDVISRDIATDPLWDSWREGAISLGFRACWSKPVFASNGDVIASFGFYFSEPREPPHAENLELSRLRGLASLAIERARMLEALRESEEHYRHTVEQNPQIPWTANPKGDILSVSSRWVDATGVSQDDALGNGWLQVIHPDDLVPTIESWEESLSTGNPVDVHYRIHMKDGGYRWHRARATARLNENGRIVRWYGTVEDVHQNYLARQRLEHQAYQDELTGLPNRRRFVEELRRKLVSASGPLGLLVLDMDDFKIVNDRFGHLTGDAVLRLFGLHLRRLAEPAEFVARLGGDEFAIICHHIADDESLLARAQTIEALLDESMRASKKARSCKASIGCALGRPGESPDEVFKRADLALYAAKAAGKGAVRMFDPTIRSAASQRSVELDLARTALREGWIEAFYQPVIRLETMEPRGFEALLRIRHPQDGVLAPFAIRAALDDPRLADAIGIRMARVIVADMARWRHATVGYGQVSINLATENLVAPAFVDTLLALLDEHRIGCESVKLEITERVLMDEQGDRIRQTLTRLRDSGIGISLDDFGTGYASLVHLKTLPVDEIKIDRSFVSGLGTSANRGEIIEAMIGLARKMRLVTVAEGIETQREATKLASWGCEFGQGYLFGQPMCTEDVAGYLAKGAGAGRAKLRIAG